MRQSIAARSRHTATRLALPAAIATALLVPGGAGGTSTKHVVNKASNTTLGKVILVNTRSRTLYSLSVEKHGKFICTGSCTSTWHPLVVPAGVKPTGPVALGTIKRPDSGKTQVTYKGRPLYSFAEDKKAGDANGEGIKDVGTWHAAVVSKIPTPPPPPPENPYPYPY